MEQAIVKVQDNSSGLMAAAPPRADTTPVGDDVDGVVKRYQKLKGLVKDRYGQLEAGNQEILSFQVGWISFRASTLHHITDTDNT